MRRDYDVYSGNESGVGSSGGGDGVYFSDPYQSPPYIPPFSSGGDGEYFSDPYISPVTGNPVVDTGLQLQPGQSYRPGVSRVGPSASVQPYMDLRPGMPAGSLFRGRFGGGSQYRGRVPYQRGFSVELQEQLRRRRKGRGLFL